MGLSDTVKILDKKKKNSKIFLGVFLVPCYHPLKAWPTSFRSESGKPVYKITSFEATFRDVYPLLDYGQRLEGKPIEIPCGKCIGCRLAYSRQWADRCMAESLYHEHSYFVTLTYDEDHVPYSYYADPDTGEALPALTLKARDLQLWLKRFRKKFGEGIRFYACGEYGENTLRPHYHVLLFGCHFDDLVPLKFVRGNWYFTSESLLKTWGLGHCLVGSLTWESAAYTARYVMKKSFGFGSAEYEIFNIEPEFVRMSRRPGIGRQFYDDNKDDLYKFGSISIATPTGGKKLHSSRYYDRLFDLENPDLMSSIKEKRRDSAISSMKSKLKNTDLGKLEYLEVQEESCIDRAKKLIREEI